jgi:hypothetical protein
MTISVIGITCAVFFRILMADTAPKLNAADIPVRQPDGVSALKITPLPCEIQTDCFRIRFLSP